MKDIEFVKRIIALLDEDEIQNIVKNIAKYGFYVQGFSKPYKAAKRTIIGSLSSRRKGGKANYEILLENISISYCLEKSNECIKMLITWKEDENRREELVQELLKLEENKKQSDNVSVEQIMPTNKDVIQEEINTLILDNEVLRERIKKLQTTLQHKKIEIDNVKKQYEKLLKDFEKLKIEKNNQVELSGQKEKIIQTQLKLIEEQAQDIVFYQNQVEDLKKYKENAPKIICFIKSKELFDFEGYDIDIFDDWNANIKEYVEGKNYDEIWYVHKNFAYTLYMEIKNFFECNIREFRTIEQLAKEMPRRK